MSKFAEMSDLQLYEAAAFRYAQIGKDLVYKAWVSGMAKSKIGQVVGAKDGKGYLTVHFCGKQVKVHQISFLLKHKRWPLSEIDHKDRNILNNDPDNLIESSSRSNQLNRSNNVETPYLYFRKDTHKYCIKVRDPNIKKSFNFGNYNSKEEAEYIRKKVELAYPFIEEAYNLYKEGKL